jgi:hypothetical protein
MQHQLRFLDFQVLERIYHDPWDDRRLLVAVPWARFPCSFIENNHLLWCLCLKVIWFLDFAYMVASCRLFPATQNADLSLSTMCKGRGGTYGEACCTKGCCWSLQIFTEGSCQGLVLTWYISFLALSVISSPALCGHWRV